MSCTGGSDCMCGCCVGTSVQTPQARANLPGLSSISYKVGTWATFKDSMLARLSSSDYPSLNALRTRDNDDFTIALIDATSVVLDILGFYQERLANESYLRTAGQLRSLVELSRLIGYEPAPGVAAAAYVAFTLKAAPGQTPDPSTRAITIPKGTQMQSVPAQGQVPQTFETSADIPAKSDWNALAVQTGDSWIPQMGDLSVYLQGTATQLQPGDLILIVGNERAGSPGKASVPSNNNWDLRMITTVIPDGTNNRTYVKWTEGLGYAPDNINPAQDHPKFYAFRQRAALFGYNAVSPVMLSDDNLKNLQSEKLVSGTPPPPNIPPPEWLFEAPSSTTPLIDLDAVYGKIITDGWIALIRPDNSSKRTPAGFITLHQVESVTTITRSAYALTSRITRALVDTSASDLNPYYSATRETSAAVLSEQLVVPEQPFLYPLYGNAVALEELRPDLSQVTVIAITGKRQKLSVKVAGLQFVPDDGSAEANLDIGALLTLTSASSFLEIPGSSWNTGSGQLTLAVEDAKGRPGMVKADLTNFVLAPSTSNDPFVSECALVQTVTAVPGMSPYTLFTLQSSLLNCYERATTTINANVVMATNGRSVSEVMGNGSASTPNQSFTLKQSPVTYVQAATPTGRQSTLQVQVSGVDWTEVPTLYQQPPSAQVFASLNQSDGTRDVIFGDGVEGATLPTGQNNLQANYRIGSGLAGNVAAGTLTTLMDRPLGVSGVTNPQSATGGQAPQSVDGIRSTAPQTVLTLGRAVSIADYESYASTFAGISKAYAIWIPSGPGRGVFLSVAGVNGEALPPSNPTLGYLIDSLQNFGNPLIPITAISFLETLFSLSADVRYDPRYTQPTVQAQILATLSETYSFVNRTFGQGVSWDEIAAVIQAVPGVIAVNVTSITPGVTSAAGDLAGQGGAFSITKMNNWLAQQITTPLPRPPSDPSRICPYLPIPSLTALPQPAEILVLDPSPAAVKLGVMS